MTPELPPTLLAIEAIKLEDVPTFLLERWAPRKTQAVAVRALFKQLGIKGISVTVPVYANASTVYIRVPSVPRPPEALEEWAKAYNGGENANDTPLGRLYVRHSNIRRHMGSILAKAFPNHLDRSDVQSDYFDSKWSVS